MGAPLGAKTSRFRLSDRGLSGRLISHLFAGYAPVNDQVINALKFTIRRIPRVLNNSDNDND